MRYVVIHMRASSKGGGNDIRSHLQSRAQTQRQLHTGSLYQNSPYARVGLKHIGPINHLQISATVPSVAPPH